MSTNGIINYGGLTQAETVNYSDQDAAGSEELHTPEIKVWRLVLTGGPCVGKTTAQVKIIYQECVV